MNEAVPGPKGRLIPKLVQMLLPLAEGNPKVKKTLSSQGRYGNAVKRMSSRPKVYLVPPENLEIPRTVGRAPHILEYEANPYGDPVPRSVPSPIKNFIAQHLNKEAMYKLAMSFELRKLLEAKKLSDKKEYMEKNRIIGMLLNKYPKHFIQDSVLNPKYVGITHKPTGFKIHAPKRLIPSNILRRK